MNDDFNRPRRREANSLLDFDSEEIVYQDEVKLNNSREDSESRYTKNSYNNERRDERQNYDKLFDKEKKKDKDKNMKFNNPVYKLIKNNNYYDKRDASKALIKQDGLYMMLRDLKDWKKNPKDKKRPFYIQDCLRDIVVAAALPSAIQDIKKDNKYELEKKDFDLLMDEIFTVVKTSEEDSRMQNKYGKDAIEAMREAYMSILYKFNKKKLKKLEDLNLDEAIAKKIVILTSGKNPNNSFYALLKFFYRNAKRIEISEKLFIKIFKVCYGKDSLPVVIKCLMNEKMNPIHSGNPFNEQIQENSSESKMYVMLDKLMRDQLEKMSKRECKKTIMMYVKDRKIAKRKGDEIRRRFGDRRTIHPEDYPKLTEVLENLEADDFSIIEYLR